MNDQADSVYVASVAKIFGASVSMLNARPYAVSDVMADAGCGVVVNTNASAAGSSWIELPCFHAAQLLPLMPASNEKPEYNACPALLRAPANRLAITAFCAAVRQVPSRAPVQVGTSLARLKAVWHALRLLIMPSVVPSNASHLASTWVATMARSAALRDVVMSGNPALVLAVATVASCCAL
ncbi:hypothetical protein LMG8323_01111 [Ralstonia mannitolilytica]|nr:hypothetical protein LMG8323_01111 [Ralstonia mannitolilytica]